MYPTDRLNECPQCGHLWHPGGPQGSCRVVWMGKLCGCRSTARRRTDPAARTAPPAPDAQGASRPAMFGRTTRPPVRPARR